MLSPLRQFMQAKRPSLAEARASLRLAYLLAFGMQLVFAAAVALAMRLIVGPQVGTATLLAQSLVVVALLGFPIAHLVARQLARPGGKAGALSGAIALGVLLSTPAWFWALVWLTGGTLPYQLVFAALLAAYFALGLWQVRAYAELALSVSDIREDEAN